MKASGSSDDVRAAAAAIGRGELVVYPTETVYGLGGDALDPDAIRRVFTAKYRPRDDPLSLGVPTVDAVQEFVRLDEETRAFMTSFLPGPVTVVCEKRPVVPDELTGGRDRVGVRIPDHPIARSLLERVAPVTATSANVSGRESAVRVADLDRSLLEAVTVVIDGGETPGGASTVVDPERQIVHRRGDQAAEVEAWLEARE